MSVEIRFKLLSLILLVGIGCDGSEAPGIDNADCVPFGQEACENGTITLPGTSDSAVCGNGYLEVGEQCDAGGESSVCNVDCTFSVCGDGVPNRTSGEKCDGDCPTACSPVDRCFPVMISGDAALCTSVCVADEPIVSCVNNDGCCPSACDSAQDSDCESICGDGIAGTREECDEGDLNSDTTSNRCRTDCRLARCGDGVVDDGEFCDNGAGNSDHFPDACRMNCGLPSCGDGTVDVGETCDMGELNSDIVADRCRSSCRLPFCGDGVIDATEGCDDRDSNSDLPSESCRTNCQLSGCGDGILDAEEACDSGVANSDTVSNACRLDCSVPECGDGVTDSGEECDNGSDNSNVGMNACRLDCRRAFCGDGVIDSNEACDNGANNSDFGANACRTNCGVATCGDGVVDTGELCDRGAGNSDILVDACRSNCFPAGCGDGVLDSGELCDEGGENSDVTITGCNTNCLAYNDAGEGCDNDPVHDCCNAEQMLDNSCDSLVVLNPLGLSGTTSVVSASALNTINQDAWYKVTVQESSESAGGRRNGRVVVSIIEGEADYTFSVFPGNECPFGAAEEVCSGDFSQDAARQWDFQDTSLNTGFMGDEGEMETLFGESFVTWPNELYIRVTRLEDGSSESCEQYQLKIALDSN